LEDNLLEYDRMEIGEFIQNTRERKKLSRKKVYTGVCNKRTYECMENGKEIMDIFLLEKFLSKLHVQYRLIDLNLSDEEFAISKTRERIELCIEKYETKQAEECISELEKQMKEGVLKEQYILWKKAQLMEETDPKTAGEWYEQALHLTVNEIDKRLLAEDELEMYLGYRRCSNKMTLQEQEEWLCWIERELFEQQIFPQGYFRECLDMAETFYAQGKWTECLECCERGRNYLKVGKKYFYLADYLRLMVKCYEELAKSEEDKYKLTELREMYCVVAGIMGSGLHKEEG